MEKIPKIRVTEMPYRVPAIPESENSRAMSLDELVNEISQSYKRIMLLPDDQFREKIIAVMDQTFTGGFSDQIIGQYCCLPYLEKIADRIIKNFQELLQTGHMQEDKKKKINLLRELLSSDDELRHFYDSVRKLKGFSPIFTPMEDLNMLEDIDVNSPEQIQNAIRHMIRNEIPFSVIKKAFFKNSESTDISQQNNYKNGEIEQLILATLKSLKEKDMYRYESIFSALGDLEFARLISQEDLENEMKKLFKKYQKILSFKVAMIVTAISLVALYSDNLPELLSLIGIILITSSPFIVPDNIVRRAAIKHKFDSKYSLASELITRFIDLKNKRPSADPKIENSKMEAIYLLVKKLLDNELSPEEVLIDGEVDFSKIANSFLPTFRVEEVAQDFGAQNITRENIVDAEFEDEEIEEDIPFKRVLKTSSKTGF